MTLGGCAACFLSSSLVDEVDEEREVERDEDDVYDDESSSEPRFLLNENPSSGTGTNAMICNTELNIYIISRVNTFN